MVISIDYDEGGSLEYESVRLYSGLNEKDLIFNTGDFVNDWFTAIKTLVTEPGVNDGSGLQYSSSVNDFITDTNLYDSAYLITENEKSELIYDTAYYNKALQFFVPKNEKLTWEELKTRAAKVTT